jgi:peroxiredoxin
MVLASLFFASPLCAKSLELQDLHGKSVDISAYPRESKKPLLLFFWTTWCPFCMKEIKSARERGQELGKTVDLFAVNAGENKAAVERTVTRYNLDIRVFLDEKMAAVDEYGIVGVPTYVLLDTNGSVIFKDNFFPEAEIKKLKNK